MTRVDVHFNIPAAGRLLYGCRLVRKIHRSGARLVIYDSDRATLERLDQSLWTFSPLDFIPHVMAEDELSANTPVVLASRLDEGLPHHDILLNLGSAPPPYLSRFERLIDLVADDEAARSAGRERWRHYADRGYPITRHKFGDGADETVREEPT